MPGQGCYFILSKYAVSGAVKLIPDNNPALSAVYLGRIVPSHGVDPAIAQQLQQGSHCNRGRLEELKEDDDEPEEQSLKKEGLEGRARDQDNEQEEGRKNGQRTRTGEEEKERMGRTELGGRSS